MVPTQERKRNNRQINKTFSLPMEEVLVQPLLLSPYFCLKYAVHYTWYFFSGLLSRLDMYHLLVTIIRLFPDVIFLPQIQVKGR